MEIPIQGLSMLPSIQPGDQLSVTLFDQPRALSSLKSGEVVLVQDSGQWVVHRLVEYQQKKYCKGDWAYRADDVQWVWGRVTAINSQWTFVLKSPWMAKLSALDLRFQNPWFRRMRKSIFWLYYQMMEKVKGLT